MTAQYTAESIVEENKGATTWGLARLYTGLTYLICQAAVLVIVVIAPYARQAASILETSTFVSLSLAAAFLAVENARSFQRGQTARRAWTFIAVMPMADALAYAAYTWGDFLGTQAKSTLLIGVGTALLSITRIGAAMAFLNIVRVYRRSGLPLLLRTRDYLGMAAVTALEVVALVFSSSGARESGGVELQKLVLILAIPLVIALAPCSVLGVIIWRYTSGMGGGLVAKAWRCNLAYGAAWLAYIALNAVVAYYLPASQTASPLTLPYILFNGVDWVLKGSVFLIFLGASYQYEACRTAPKI
ncbi:MAG TPA: hypothetical protein VI756_31165 [Blastocatellia bacterium]